jgi:NDP-sugar pyrophosphorylase family protein
VVLEEDAEVTASIIWPNTRIGQHAVVDGAIIARNCHIGRNVTLRGQAVLGDKTALTDYTKL